MLFTRCQYSGSINLDHGQSVPQPSSRRGPLALYGGSGNAQKLRRLIDLKTTEESQLDYVGKPWVHHGKVIQGLIEREEFEVVRTRRRDTLGQIDANEGGAALVCTSPPRIIHQDPPHELGGGAKEVFAALPME